jgi:hypothetical protein
LKTTQNPDGHAADRLDMKTECILHEKKMLMAGRTLTEHSDHSGKSLPHDFTVLSV